MNASDLSSEPVPTLLSMAYESSTLSNVMSTYRPFGYLPMYPFTVDQVFAVFGASCGVGALAVVLFATILAFLIKHHQVLVNVNINQRLNIILLLLTNLFVILGLFSTDDASRQYPLGQTVYGQLFNFVSFVGLTVCFLPSLFFRPLLLHKSTFGEAKEERYIIVTCASICAVGLGLEVAVLSLGTNTPRGLVIAIFAYKIASLLLIMGVGTYSLIITSNEEIRDAQESHQSEEDSKNGTPKRYIREVTIETTDRNGKTVRYKEIREVERGFALKWRLFYLMISIVSLSLFMVASSIESPIALWMRGCETISLFFILIVLFFYSWSVFKTLFIVVKGSPAIFDGEDIENTKEGDDQSVEILTNGGAGSPYKRY